MASLGRKHPWKHHKGLRPPSLTKRRVRSGPSPCIVGAVVATPTRRAQESGLSYSFARC
ncbi:hypothetical protein BJV77DRAFT_1017640 [Russula vinacea]|nr:hypothetical protein BJV77DRAFT_1017640 [Russula vinacea]